MANQPTIADALDAISNLREELLRAIGGSEQRILADIARRENTFREDTKHMKEDLRNEIEGAYQLHEKRFRDVEEKLDKAA